MLRCDYAKFAVKLTVAAAVQAQQDFINAMEQHPEQGKEGKGYNITSVRRYDDGTYLYVFETWGVQAEAIQYLDFDRWSKHLDRLDVRRDMDVSPSGVNSIYNHLLEHKAGNRNVQLFNSRTRSKRQGRQSGGQGIAIGSHKSDFRMTVYKRGNERGAIEFQLQGKRIQDAVKGTALVKSMDGLPFNESPWAFLIHTCDARGASTAEETFNLGYQAVTDMARGIDPDMLKEERMLEQADKLIERMNKPQLQAVLSSVQLRLGV